MAVADRAANALDSLKLVILEYLEKHPNGVGNSQLARDLGLESDFQGRQKNYLSWAVIGLLVNEGRVVFQKMGRNTFYKLP
ncbi:hypothetical protein QE400_003760 [Xanthomonas sacchari]|uniref:hypothetical protein n=1 Tax=Xanthomonas sacchari TaxID=56458 RepID=UPI00277F42DE|nr:hypothetical protein [Xanthomonas sacchari]MDQ1094347.1 hypothetical protein [Xanthomonas sacchari]